jgi:ketosteroid isomerase-like protein
MTPYEALVQQFYQAFQQRDWQGMQACYHTDVVFRDPVFPELRGPKAKAMWHMLVTAGTDLRIEFDLPVTEGDAVTCRWRAFYTFSKTGRLVENHIQARFRFRDGLIVEHTDLFDLWRWSRMALGATGIWLGWTPFVHNKIRTMAAKNLTRFLERNPEN